MNHSASVSQLRSSVKRSVSQHGRALRNVHSLVFRIVVVGGVMLITGAALLSGSGDRQHKDQATQPTTGNKAASQLQSLPPATPSTQEATSMNQSNQSTSNGSSSDNRSTTKNAQSQSVSSSVSSTTINGQTSTSVNVNGQEVPVPASGQLHRTIHGPNGTTRVDISNDNDPDQSGTNSTSSSVQIDVHSSNAP